MDIGHMKYKDLVRKIPSDMEVEFEGKGGYVIAKLKKSKPQGVRLLPAMF